MLDNNTLDEMKRLIYIGQNKIYQHQERLDAFPMYKNWHTHHTNPEVIQMKDKQEKKDQERFNSNTHKSKPENQNQHHNVRKEGVDAKMRQV